MKQQEVAKKMGITVQRYSQLENHRKLSIKRINEILIVLGYTIATAEGYIESIPLSIK